MVTKEKIRQAVININGTKNLSNITVSEVVQKAEISRSTFYTYYDDLYSVMDEIENELIVGMKESINGTEQFHLDKHHVNNPSYLDVSVLKYVFEHKKEFVILLGQYGDPLFRYKYVEFLKEFCASKYLRDYNIEDHHNLISVFLVNGLISVVEEWLINHSEISPEKMERITTKLLHGYFIASKQ